MINIYINSKIYIKLKDVPQELRLKIMKEYRFKYYTFRGKQREERSINLMEVKELKGNKWVCLPPNLTYLLNVLKTSDVNFQVIDNRVKPKIENFPKVTLELREQQLEAVEEMEKHDYNCLLALATSSGKTTISVKLAQILSTTSLFVASNTTFIESYTREIHKFVQDPEKNLTVINTEWLRNGAKITPYMVASIQALSNKKILEALENKVGLLIMEEIHKNLTAEKSRETLYSLNPRYRISLSATPKAKAEGYIECALTPNIITKESKLDFDIQFIPVITDLGFSTQREYKNLEHYHEKKDFVFNKEQLLISCSEFISWLDENDRGVMVYCTNKYFQEELYKSLMGKGINTICFNSSTKKENYPEYFRDYDSGKIRVIIGGKAVEEAISIYRLSVILDVDLSINENSLIQLIGRLKRKDDKVSDKSKIYIKLMYKNMNENKLKFVIKPTIKNYMKDYVKILEPKVSKDFELLDIFV